MTYPNQISTDQANAAAVVNEELSTVRHVATYGRKHSTTTGLTWGYYGGRFGSVGAVADGTLSLTASSTNYIVVAIATGVISVSTATTNWNDATNYRRVYKVPTGTSTITEASIEDHRFGPGGLIFGGGSSSVAAADVSITDAAGDFTATDVEGALAELQADAEALATTVSGKAPLATTVTALSIGAGAANIDCSLGDYFTLALTANVTSITFSNLPGSGRGASKWIQITQDSTPRTVAWPASFKWAGGSAGAVSTGSGAVDELAITTVDNGATWKATLGKGYS